VLSHLRKRLKNRTFFYRLLLVPPKRRRAYIAAPDIDSRKTLHLRFCIDTREYHERDRAVHDHRIRNREAMHMIDFIFKGSILPAEQDVGSEELRFRLFDNLGEVHLFSFDNSYSTIGVGICMGDREVASRHIRFSLLNISRNPRHSLFSLDYMRGSSFIIITWHQDGDVGFDALLDQVQSLRGSFCDTSIAIAVQANDGEPDIPVLAAMIDDALHLPCIIVENHNELLNQLLLGSMQQEPSLCLLPVRSLDEIGPARPRPNDSSFRLPASKRLLALLQDAGFTFVDNRTILMKKQQWLFEISLDEARVHVAHASCMDCNRFSMCKESFKKLCIVQAAPEGFASKALGLQSSDLFFLSLIYAIEFDQLPSTVVGQFPNRKNCSYMQHA